MRHFECGAAEGLRAELASRKRATPGGRLTLKWQLIASIIDVLMAAFYDAVLLFSPFPLSLIHIYRFVECRFDPAPPPPPLQTRCQFSPPGGATVATPTIQNKRSESTSFQTVSRLEFHFHFISSPPRPPANHPPPKTAVNVAHDQATPPQPAPRCRQQNQLTKNHKRINSLATLQKIENWNLPEKNISNSTRNINSSAKIPPDGELEWNKIMIIISDKETFQKKRKR